MTVWSHAHCWLERHGGWNSGEETRQWARDQQEGEEQFLHTGPISSWHPRQKETLGPTLGPRE